MKRPPSPRVTVRKLVTLGTPYGSQSSGNAETPSLGTRRDWSVVTCMDLPDVLTAEFGRQAVQGYIRRTAGKTGYHPSSSSSSSSSAPISEHRVPFFQGHQIIGTDTDRSGTYNFPLVVHNNHEPIPYRLRDKRQLPSKNCKCKSYPVYLTLPLMGGSPWYFVKAARLKKTRMMVLPGGR